MLLVISNSVTVFGFTTVFITLFIVLVTIIWRRTQNIDRQPSPPGPWGWPYIGSLFSIKPPAYLYLHELARTYGSVYQIKLGPQTVVVLDGYRALHEALVKQVLTFSGRPDFPDDLNVKHDRKLDLVFSNYSQETRFLRKLVYTALQRCLVENIRGIEEVITRQALAIVDCMSNGGVYDPFETIHVGVANILCTVCFSKSFSYDDMYFRGLVLGELKVQRSTGLGSIKAILPTSWSSRPSQSQRRDQIHNILTFIEENVTEHLRNPQPQAKMDMVDLMRQAMPSDEQNRGDKSHIQLSDVIHHTSEISHMIVSLIRAGFDTIGKTLHVFICYMLVYPEVQKRLGDELHSVVGHDRPPTLDDRSRLPLVDACLHEVLRHASMAPLGVYHSTIKDTTLFGYHIPRGTPIITNLWSSDHDDAEWIEPDKFIPERFLTNDGSQLNRRLTNKVAVFSMGARRCLGEKLAQMELFLFVAVWLHKCRFECMQGDEPKLKFSFDGITLKAERYSVLTSERVASTSKK
ncbi:cytochrome P450 1B1-like [Glandiceps talaboti]